MKHTLVLSTLLLAGTLSAAQWTVKPAANPKAPGKGLAVAKDGKPVHNMEDDVIRGATVTYQGEITFPPPPPESERAPAHAVIRCRAPNASGR